jgi:excinuclease UvrABC helicase subunit UvrB
MMLKVEISHEFGHLVQWDLHVMADAGDLMAARLLDEFAEIMENLYKIELEKISRYASTSTKDVYQYTRFQFSEGFAESFSVYINNKGKDVLPETLFNFFKNKLIPL